MSNFKDYLEEEISWDDELKKLFEKAGEKSSEEIAKELGISRQMVHKTLKKSLGKIYKVVKDMYPDKTPFELGVILAEMMDAEDMNEFFTLFPGDIKKEITQDAKNYI